MMLEQAVVRVRRLLAAMSWRQWVTVMGAIAVVVAMVYVAENAQRDSERHLHVQVLVERVQASSEAIDSLMWQGIGEMLPSNKQHGLEDSPLVTEGWSVWTELSNTLKSLLKDDGGAEANMLERDANTLVRNGMPALAVYDRGNLSAAQRVVRKVFQPAVYTLDTDSQRAAANEQAVADQASRRAEESYIGSLLIGLLLLLLLGSRLYRMRRHTVIADERRSIERRSEERLRALVEHSSDVISVVGPDLTVRWQSTSLHSTLGHDPAGLVGRRLTELVHPGDAPLVEGCFAAGRRSPGSVTFSARFRHADGQWRHLETIAENRLADPAVQGIVLSMRDVTDRKALEDELRHQAFHDALTGLANRALFEDRLAHALAGARRHGRPVTVVFFDLDDFKTINDSLGHTSGDELLRAVALRIAGVVRPTDTAARLGGDEFAVLLESADEDQDAEVIAARILETLAPSFRIGERDLKISASVGVASSDGSIGAGDLLRNADTAMYAAKERGKNTVQGYEEGMHRAVLDRLELTGELRRALEQEEFELDYQPIVELESGRIAGAEALVRWIHPERGRLAPGHFIGLAEETGLIVPLGTWILRSACAQASEWHRQFPSREPLHISVNVSTRQLYEPGFPAIVADTLERTGLDPSALILEITESLLAEDDTKVIGQLENLKALGVRVAVDDFGTGYSALSRLQHFPIDVLKIDRSFIDGIEHDPGKAKLVRGIVNLGENLRLEVVAEGIEQREQADQLRAMNSQFGQGFLFSRPVSREVIEELLITGSPLTLATFETEADTRAA